MRSGYIKTEQMHHVLAALTPANRLACEISIATGLRISDVLNLPSNITQRYVVREAKTGKRKTIYLPLDIYKRAISMAGKYFIFEHRNNPKWHRTRQAVYRDIRRAANLFRIKYDHISPHSCRKNYAVDQYAIDGDLKRVQRLLNHNDEAVTMIYAMADILSKK